MDKNTEQIIKSFLKGTKSETTRRYYLNEAKKICTLYSKDFTELTEDDAVNYEKYLDGKVS